MAERIRAAQEEPWRKHQYIDEDSGEAWESYNEHLFMEETDAAPKLVSAMANPQYLDAISAPRDAARLSRSKNIRRRRGTRKGKGKATGANGEDNGDSDSSGTLSQPPSSGESDEDAA